MRHRISGKQLSRTTPHRRALRRNLASSLIQHGAVRTTPAKAKEVRPFVERLITIAREGTLHARRRVIQLLQDRAIYTYEDSAHDYVAEDRTVVQKLFDEVAPRYADRPGGYTRIVHLPERRIGDGGRQVLLQLVEGPAAQASEGGAAPAQGSRRRRRAARRAEAVAAAGEVQADEAETPAEPEQDAPDADQAEAPEADQDAPDAEAPEADPEETEK